MNFRAELLENRPTRFWVMVCIGLVLGVAVLDTLTGYELAFSLFYLLPIAVATWYGNRNLGLLLSLASAISWFTADTLMEHPYSHPAIPYWNTAIRFGIFLVVTLLISELKKAHEREKGFARNDYLTGAVNRRYFNELLEMEMNRSARNSRPLCLAYVDLDNFKYVNDHFGHAAGDAVLCTTVQYAKARLRKVDVVARLGGDEFAILLSETHQADARVVITEIRNGLLEEMQRQKWPVTFSFGVLTCHQPPATPEALIKAADQLMYRVKHAGKDSVEYAEYQNLPA